MSEKYKIVYSGGTGEIVEKKSRFIANVKHVRTEEEAVEFVESIKKKYWDATHNCVAFTVGRNGEVKRSSDDGEPSGTAGRPMLEVLEGMGLHNVAVVVTRYFGGTLLGTGGLVRAYGGAVKAGLENCTIVTKCPGVKIKLETDYTDSGKIQYIIKTMNLMDTDTQYTDRVLMEVVAAKEDKKSFLNKITEATSGRVKIKSEKEVWFADNDGKCIFFDN